MISDPEVSFRRIERSVFLALIAMGIGALANAAVKTAQHVGAELGVWNGALLTLQIVGYLVFGILMVGGVIAGQRMDPEDRARFSDELAQAVSARAARASLVVTIVLSAILMAVDIDWPGAAAASVLYAAAVMTLAIVLLRSDA